MDCASEFNVAVVDQWRHMETALNGQPYTTFHLGDQANRKPDDAHPNDAGHRVWAEGALKVIQQGVAALNNTTRE